jgi:hypothetical protein
MNVARVAIQATADRRRGRDLANGIKGLHGGIAT